MYKGFKHDNIVVVGAGYNAKLHWHKIRELIEDCQCVTIGINKMTKICYPTYHLWTNRRRYSTYGKCVRPDKSIIMLGCHMLKRIQNRLQDQLFREKINNNYNTLAHWLFIEDVSKYITVVYTDEAGEDYNLCEEHIRGYFRTAGTLAVSIAYLMEAKNIWIIGMDGFTLHSHEALKKKKVHQHCYGQVYSDDTNWEKCIRKDEIVANILDNLSKIISFKIITPTKFTNHYDPTILGIE